MNRSIEISLRPAENNETRLIVERTRKMAPILLVLGGSLLLRLNWWGFGDGSTIVFLTGLVLGGLFLLWQTISGRRFIASFGDCPVVALTIEANEAAQALGFDTTRTDHVVKRFGPDYGIHPIQIELALEDSEIYWKARKHPFFAAQKGVPQDLRAVELLVRRGVVREFVVHGSYGTFRGPAKDIGERVQRLLAEQPKPVLFGYRPT